METKMRSAYLTFAMVLSPALVVSALWYFTEAEAHQHIQVDRTHEHRPSQLGDLWLVLSPGFR